MFSISPNKPTLHQTSDQPHRVFQVTVFCLITSGILACGGDAQLTSTAQPPVTVQGSSPNGPNDESGGHSPHNNTSQTEGRYSTVNDGVWPPQPTAASNIKPYIPSVNFDEAEIIKVEKASQLAALNQKVLLHIGTDHTLLKTTVVTGKLTEQGRTEFEYFNYKTNQLKRITISGDQQKIQVSSTAAYLYQPPETRAEVAKAIRLAGLALTKQGYNDIQNLIGTALLAHPTSSEISANGQTFYSDRYLYVTFGEGVGRLPQYRALVNLSTDTVSNSGVVQ